jgi:hypothetical protein
MATKRPTLTEAGVGKLFRPSVAETPAAPLPNAIEAVPESATPAPSPSEARWEATHRRRTFHCPNATWDRLEAWCRQSGMSRSAAITQALDAFLAAQEQR